MRFLMRCSKHGCKCQPTKWPADAPAPPANAVEALDTHGRWGATACGVDIRACADVPAKGRGAYAARQLEAGALVGVYWGEPLTQRQWAVRHGWKSGERPVRLTDDEARELDARKRRLDALDADQGVRPAESRPAAAVTSASISRTASLFGGPGAPMGGVDNGGAYVFSVLLAATEPERLPPGLGGRVLYLDAEDGNRSNCELASSQLHHPQLCTPRALRPLPLLA